MGSVDAASSTAIPTGRNLFCAGHIQLQDGRLLVAGGHIQAYEGTKDTNLFNPQTATWQRGADMACARWYPTVTGLPDGRVFVVSGDGITLKDQHNQNVEVPLTDRARTRCRRSTTRPRTRGRRCRSAARRMPLYPFMFVLPDGRLFDAGPERMTRTLEPRTGQWTNVGTSPIDGRAPSSTGRARSSSPAPGPTPSSPAARRPTAPRRST